MAGRNIARPRSTDELTHRNAGAPATGLLKPYVSIAELAQLTPWTDQAIRTMMSKGILRPGRHFFYVGRRAIFKWSAIVAFIEQSEELEGDRVPHYRDNSADGTKA
jgi:hypothetical protein